MDSTPGLEVFESYETDYKSLSASISDLLKEARDSKGEAKRAVLRRAEHHLEEGDEILEQMEVEVQSVPRDHKTKLQIKLRSYKGELARFKTEVKTSLQSSDRDELLGGRYRDDDVSPSDLEANTGGLTQAQRQRLLGGVDKLADGQRRLEDSHRIALETEDLGAGILTDLRSQREQITNTRDTLYRADNSIDRASGTLKQMIRRMYQQRLITGAIITVLVVLILFVLWAKLF